MAPTSSILMGALVLVAILAPYVAGKSSLVNFAIVFLLPAHFKFARSLCVCSLTAEEETIQFTYKKSAELDCSKLGEKVKFFVKQPNATDTEPEELKSNEQVIVSDNKVIFKDLSTLKQVDE